MQKTAKFGHVWRHKKTGKTLGAKIDVDSIDEIHKYKQVLRSKETVETKPEEVKKETTNSVSKTRGN